MLVLKPEHWDANKTRAGLRKQSPNVTTDEGVDRSAAACIDRICFSSSDAVAMVGEEMLRTARPDLRKVRLLVTVAAPPANLGGVLHVS